MTDLNPIEKNSKPETGVQAVGRGAADALLKMSLEAALSVRRPEPDTTKHSEPDMDQSTVKKLIEAAKKDLSNQHSLEIPNFWHSVTKIDSAVNPNTSAIKNEAKTESPALTPDDKLKNSSAADRAHRDYAPPERFFK